MIKQKDNKLSHYTTDEKLKLLQMIAEKTMKEKMTLSQACKELHISRQAIYLWLDKDDEFRSSYNRMRRLKLETHAVDIDNVLVKHAKRGSAEHIKVFYRKLGELEQDQSSNLQVIINQIPRPYDISTYDVKQSNDTKESIGGRGEEGKLNEKEDLKAGSLSKTVESGYILLSFLLLLFIKGISLLCLWKAFGIYAVIGIVLLSIKVKIK